jgi:tripartite-type tricarboxylate transporter receptor subunit TctC
MCTHKLLAALIVPAALLAAPAAIAQGKYPDKPIRLIVGSAAGSGPDIFSRALGDQLYKTWNQRLVVDARPGAAGAISAELALRAIPDGYTLMMLTSQLLVASEVLSNINFNLARDFKSVSLIGTVPFVQMVNPNVPVKSVPELIALAKKQQLRYGSAGTGATEHLSGVLFTHLSGTKMLHVPYKGIAQAIADTLAQEVQLTYAVMPAAVPHLQAQRLRPLGVTTSYRSKLFPEIPSISETLPGYETMGWYSIVAPNGTPESILNQISAEIQKAAKDPSFNATLTKLGSVVVGSDRAGLDAHRQSQTKIIAELVKVSGAKQ